MKDCQPEPHSGIIGETILASEISACRICEGGSFLDVLDLGEHALSGRFPAETEPDAPTAALRLILCTDCGLLQLRNDFERDALYRHHYGYRSGINESMRAHLTSLCRVITDTIPLVAGDVVLDVGCNDGTLLMAYDLPDVVVRIGMDPTVDQFRDFYPPEIKAISDYFNADRFAAASEGRKAKAITSIAMFYDLPDPNAFVADIARSLDDTGLWVFEQCYLPRMLELNAFDTICHEHLEYYGLAQVDTLLARHGLRVFDIAFSDVNGGSFRVHACHAHTPFVESENVSAARKREATLGLNKLETYRMFWDRIAELRSRLTGFLKTEIAKGRTVIGYGASTKGNTTLQFCGITRELVHAVADRNPAKWGRRLPATGIPIISEEEARRRKPDYFLVFPWHFRDSFIKREKSFLDSGGQFIFMMPEFEVV